MSTDANKAALKRLYAELFNKKNLQETWNHKQNTCRRSHTHHQRSHVKSMGRAHKATPHKAISVWHRSDNRLAGGQSHNLQRPMGG